MDEDTVPFPFVPNHTDTQNAENIERYYQNIDTQNQKQTAAHASRNIEKAVQTICPKRDSSTQTQPLHETVFHECPVCMENTDGPWTLLCGHTFCPACLARLIEKRRPCPECREKIRIQYMHEVYLSLS